MTSITCKYTGNANIDSNVHSRFRRGVRGQFDRSGGGADLSCNYTVNIKKEHFHAAMLIFEENVPFSELDNRLFA